VDSAGNVYVADYGNDKIRKITPAGVVTTLAGSGAQGDADGMGGAASFNYPEGIAVDSAGNLYVGDYGNNEIRKITSAGAVTTLAGSGAHGNTDGTGRAASFNSPESVAVDAGGNVYVADYGNNEIRKITPAGVVTTLAGSGAQGNSDGTGSAASFDGPEGVTVDSAGNVYVADNGNNEIRKITPAGVVTTFAGSGMQGNADGAGRAASFNGPESVAVDAGGNVYVADYGNNEIRKVTPAGVVTTLAGSGAQGNVDGAGRAASFNGPEGAAVDSSGNLYLSDEFNDTIRKITPTGVVTTFAGSSP
jgi:sugar lactone lactonase YvrE